ncbi:hypothetical protein WL80_02635 [Burkholderia ubonensis]|uniref:TauD/TfdA family dioxygenase n=1 Tax=Burkholderia ubonensis TaxID=101571 RepID=UPI0007596BB4|nr:TauD/TfdA family dioxygenase [Burkholderia ubonensis]KWF00509.1 hypothetical protein WL80_02635 [Burkholderia ubonensis]OJB18806.1 hypothetical protein BGV54_20245 [Burkholderia ubonensis]
MVYKSRSGGPTELRVSALGRSRPPWPRFEPLAADARPRIFDDGRFAFLRHDPDAFPRAWEAGCGRLLTGMLGASLGELTAALSSMRNVLRIRGLPGELDPPASPYTGVSHWPEICRTLINVFGTVHLMHACAFAYAAENGGRLVRDVVARADARHEYSSQGWAQVLPWHMDGAFRPLTDGRAFAASLSAAPRWLVFGVIYDTPSVPMVFASLDEILARLTPDDIAALCRPEFDVRSSDSFDRTHLTRAVSLLLPDGEGGYYSRFNQLHCTGTTAGAQRALGALSAALSADDIPYRLDIAAGDVVVLDNWRTLHMRSAYTPRWDGADRWLVRVYASPDERDGIPLAAATPRVWI